MSDFLLSVVIPTLNEEKYLPRLLNSLKAQTFQGFEVIVADAGSKDKTVTMAKEYGCRVTLGGRPGKGRNRGAKLARGDLILFLDADVVLPRKDFLEEVLGEFKKRGLDIAGFLLTPQTKKMADFFILETYNHFSKMTQFFSPHTAGGILVKKAIHQKINGFNQKIKVAEDHDYVKRAGKEGKFRLLKSVKLPFSMRRYDREGRFRLVTKCLLIEGHRVFFGEIRSDLFNYRFGDY